MTLLLPALAGFLSARLAWLALGATFDRPPFLRPNFRGTWIPAVAGAVLPIAALVVEAGRAVLAVAGVGHRAPAESELLVVLAAAGFGLLGLLDDIGGGADARGFRGHLGALRRGVLTTGGLKLLGGGLVAMVAAGPLAASVLELARDALLIALSANLGNLFDRAPGRALKAGLVSFGALAVFAPHEPLVGVAGVVGGGVALLGDDLGERAMLGDAGANVLGGVLGLGVVLSCGSTARWLVLAGVAALNLTSEVVSFSRLIDALAPLRALDRLGRRR